MSKLKSLLTCFFSLFTLLLFAQNRTITGKVTHAGDQTNVIGATITVKGTSQATTTSADGSFSLSVPSGAVTLVITSVGFLPKEATVAADATNVSVELSEDSQQLSEVVVTALGITREAKTLVYATQTVKPSTLTEVRDANNVLNSFQGKIANATISQGSGGPGSGARIVLRGNRSLQGNNNALIVVDGVPITNGTNGAAGSDFGSVQGSDGASNINPDDIESVTVLRGASAAALYGSAAGNGVIVITTKKGKEGKIAVTVNSGVVFEQAVSLPKVQNEYGQGRAGSGGALEVDLGDSWGVKMTGQGYTNHLGEQATYDAQPDNIKNFFRTGTSLNNSIGVTGGSEKMQTYLSYTNNSIQGIIPKNDLLRHTVNLRLTNQIGKRFSTDAKVTYIAQSIHNRPRTGEENAPTIDIYQIPRNMSTAEAEQYEMLNNVGIAEPTPWPATLEAIYQNPYWMINNTAINEVRDRIMGFITAKYEITDWLSLQGRANLDRIFDRGESQYATGTKLWAGKVGGYYAQQKITTTQKWFDVMLEGHNDITKDLKVEYRVGAIYQDGQYNAVNNTADGLNVTNKFSLNYATSPAISSSSSETQTQSVFGQLNFSFKDAIFLDASLRNDWASPLPSPYSFSYPSIGASVILSDLMQLPSAISFLKASANYASVGNGGRSQIRLSTYSYSQGAGNGFLTRSSTLPIPGLKPEIVKNLEFGIEARFINNRIGFTATYYKSNSTNQLLQVDLPVATGYANQYINAGDIQNSGFEFVVTGTPVKTKNFSWDVVFNLGMNTNKIKRLDENVKIFYLGGGYGRSATPIAEEGGHYGDMISYLWERNDKGQFVVKADGTPAITADRGSIGNFNPKATIGFSNSFEYKRFSLRLLLDGRAGGVMVSGTEMNLAFSGIPEVTGRYREGGLNLGGVDASGQPINQAITSQQFWQIASGKRYGNGEFFAYDATNFRIRELSIGYNIPVGSAFFIKNARISAVARNVVWLYRGKSKLDIPGLGKRTMWFDPDMSLGNGNFQGVEYGTLPATRTVGFDLKLTF